MPKELYFIDSNIGTKNNDPIVGASDPNYFYHTFNFYFPLKIPLQNVSRIILKSVEIPLILPTVRYTNGTVLINIMYSISTYTNVVKQIFVPPNTYTQSTLISAINSAITNAALIGSPSIVFSTVLNSTTGLYNAVITHNCTSLTIYSSYLTSYLLGLGQATITSSSTITGTYSINVNAIDTCLYMQITNLPVMNNNIFPFTFKIPLNNVVNNTVYLNDVKEHQEIIFNTNTFILDKLNVVILDRLGNVLAGYFNWTFSLIIEHDENKETIQFLNFNN